RSVFAVIDARVGREEEPAIALCAPFAQPPDAAERLAVGVGPSKLERIALQVDLDDPVRAPFGIDEAADRIGGDVRNRKERNDKKGLC
ncbi:MAG TPA: hypothetical protein VFL30_10645, partial [Rhodanobacteraceae bacterium]|nr:hypothetical protein [Rhodanobacteraceae bacterium]